MLAHFEETERREAAFCGSSDGGAFFPLVFMCIRMYILDVVVT